MQQPLLTFCVWLITRILALGSFIVGCEAMRVLICPAICSTGSTQQGAVSLRTALRGRGREAATRLLGAAPAPS